MTQGLERFHWAQADVIDQVRRELQAGHKTSHWMWFIFPQAAGLGRSATARQYAISSMAETRAYLADPVLGPRLRECCEVLLTLVGRGAEEILGGIDAIKLRSSMTLFLRADPEEAVFRQVVEAFLGGQPDERTDALL